MFTVQATLRKTGLKTKHLRKKGLIPACLYGGDTDSSVLLQFTQGEVTGLLKTKYIGSVVSLDIEGNKINALLREIVRTPITNQVEHLSFQKLSDNETINSIAKIVLVNKDKIPIYKRQLLFEIPYRAPASKLIETIKIDLNGMRLGDSIKVKDLDIAKTDGIELLIDPESMVLSIVGNRRTINTFDHEKD